MLTQHHYEPCSRAYDTVHIICGALTCDLFKSHEMINFSWGVEYENGQDSTPVYELDNQ